MPIQIYNFNVPAEYLYDPLKIEVSSGAHVVLPGVVSEPYIEPINGITLDTINSITATADAGIKYIVKRDGSYLYFNSGWIASDKTYAKSNTIAEILTNKAALTPNACEIFIIPIFDFDGSTYIEITELQIDYSLAATGIQFIVEDGTGKSDSTSYVNVQEFKQYWINKGQAIIETDNTIKAWLNQAAEYIDRKYRFKGSIVLSTQALQWPRINVWKNSLTYYLNTEIPKEVKDSVCYLAKQLQTETEFYKETSDLKSYSIGPVSKTFGNGSATRTFPITDAYLKNITLSGNEIVRAN